MVNRCGYVAIIGRPNAGKSTLFNSLVGQKVSSVTFKPQTTRHRILGVKTDKDSQFIFIDTPGIHLGGKKLLNRVLNKNALNALDDVNLIFWVIDRNQWTREEDNIKRQISGLNCPIILVVNKIDKLSTKTQLFEMLAGVAEKYPFAEIVPISALKKETLQRRINVIKDYLPASEFYYSKEFLTDRDMRFLVAEIIRESAFVYLDKELPYATHVEIEKYIEEGNRIHIAAVIFVEKESQKSILIGRQGEMLKKIGTRARQSIQRQLGVKAHLELWVKLHKDWQDNPRIVSKYEL